jgi:hypothetical protein
MDDVDSPQSLPPKESLENLGPSPYVGEGSEEPFRPNLGVNLLLFGVAGAGALVLLSATMTPTVGATRSTRLQWQQHQAEIEQAVAEASAAQCPHE